MYQKKNQQFYNEMSMLHNLSIVWFKRVQLLLLIFPFHQPIWRLAMSQPAYGLKTTHSMDQVLNFCGWDKLRFVNMFTMASAHLSTSISPQSALMFCVGKKCMKVGGILQKSLSPKVEQCWSYLTSKLQQRNQSNVICKVSTQT